MDDTHVLRRARGGTLFPWYDSVWLHQYERARAIITAVRPAALEGFEQRLRVLRTRLDFRETLVDAAFGPGDLDAIGRAVASIQAATLETHEIREFGRFIIHDHPAFTALHAEVVPLVSELAGEPVEPTFNFLALYTAKGVCDLHLDTPRAKWTLDLCLRQKAPWPIHFSAVQPWPAAGDDPRPASLPFTAYNLEPGQAVLFSGSSQWHYRDPMPRGGTFCDLLFFHFCPAGMSEWVRPQNWARLFGIPELHELDPD